MKRFAHRARQPSAVPSAAPPCLPPPTPRNLRILVVAPQPFYEDRGTPIAVLQVLEALSQLGYTVDLLTYPIGRPVEIPGVRVIRGPNPLRFATVPVGLSLRKLLLDSSLLPRLAALLRRHQYHCIHAVEEAAFAAIPLARQHGIPVVYDMQSSMPEQMTKHRIFRRPPLQAALRRCEAWLLARSDFVVSSAGLGERVRRLAPFARLREWQYPSQVTPVAPERVASLRESLGIAHDAPVVLYSGTFEAYQGLRELLAAVPILRTQVPGAVLVLVGARHSDRRRFPSQFWRLVRRGAVKLVGRQPRSEMSRFLALADVLVSPRAYGANLPLKVFDYLAAGRPIVATDIPTHRAILSESRGAVLVAPTPPALAEGIVGLLREPGRAAALGQAGRRWAEAHLGWLAFVGSVASVYEEVLAYRGDHVASPRG